MIEPALTISSAESPEDLYPWDEPGYLLYEQARLDPGGKGARRLRAGLVLGTSVPPIERSFTFVVGPESTWEGGRTHTLFALRGELQGDLTPDSLLLPPLRIPTSRNAFGAGGGGFGFERLGVTEFSMDSWPFEILWPVPPGLMSHSYESSSGEAIESPCPQAPVGLGSLYMANGLAQLLVVADFLQGEAPR